MTKANLKPDTYRVVKDGFRDNGRPIPAGVEIVLSTTAAKYPLLAGHIEPAAVAKKRRSKAEGEAE